MFDPPRYVLVCTFLTTLLVGRSIYMVHYGGLTVSNSKGGRRKGSRPNLRHSSKIPLERLRIIIPRYRCSDRDSIRAPSGMLEALSSKPRYSLATL